MFGCINLAGAHCGQRRPLHQVWSAPRAALSPLQLAGDTHVYKHFSYSTRDPYHHQSCAEAGHDLAIGNFAKGSGAGDLALKHSDYGAFTNWGCHIVQALRRRFEMPPEKQSKSKYVLSSPCNLPAPGAPAANRYPSASEPSCSHHKTDASDASIP
jgi:hypothetical protein